MPALPWCWLDAVGRDAVVDAIRLASGPSDFGCGVCGQRTGPAFDIAAAGSAMH